MSGYRVRHSLRQLDNVGNEQKKNDFLKAWKLVKELPPTNPNSFWSIATYHGMPFKDRIAEPKVTENDSWDGYCQHGNVLFPTWHRFYTLRLEQALQTVLPDGDVALHYWDATSDESLSDGLPSILVDKTVTIDNIVIDNPLLNFTLPSEIKGVDVTSDKNNYEKPKGYTTVRYPYSGIQNPEGAKIIADNHNSDINNLEQSNTELLQENVKAWLDDPEEVGKDNSVYQEFKDCITDPWNFNLFSNTTSADYLFYVYPSLEQPHNDIHLCIGGYTSPDGKETYGLLPGSNGDMGANEVASFDPIFFLHHCNIDRMFWLWQRHWGYQTKLTINEDELEIPNIHETVGVSTEAQGPTINQTPTQILGMNTILYPYQNELGVPRTSNDCIDIEGQLGYTYSEGSLENIVTQPHHNMRKISQVIKKLSDAAKELKREHEKGGLLLQAFFDLTDLSASSEWKNIDLFKKGKGKGIIRFLNKNWKRNYYLKVSRIDKDSIKGSFLVRVFVKNGEKLTFIGQRGVLDRWERKYCKNCQKHRFTAVNFHMDHTDPEHPWEPSKVVIQLISKDPMTGKEITDSIDARSKDSNKPKVQFISSFKELSN